MDRIYKALVLNDYQDKPYATWVKEGVKTIETRMREFKHRGDIVICCGASKSVGNNIGKALCIVDLWKIRPMKYSDESAACIGNVSGRKAYLLRNWRYFSEDFKFAPMAIQKNFQGLFDIKIPDDIEIIPMPQITPFEEKTDTLF